MPPEFFGTGICSACEGDGRDLRGGACRFCGGTGKVASPDEYVCPVHMISQTICCSRAKHRSEVVAMSRTDAASIENAPSVPDQLDDERGPFV